MAYDGFELPFLLFIGTFTIKICKNYLCHICTSLCVKQLKKDFMTLYINTIKMCYNQTKTTDVKCTLMCTFCTSQA